MNIDERLVELETLCEEEHSRIYKEYECEQHCDCVFTKEEIERLVDLTKEPSYSVPTGLTREERRMYIENVGRRSSYGLTKEKAERISKNTEEAYKAKYLLTKDQVRKIGEHSLRKYAETSPSDFKAEDFIDLTDVQKGGRKVKNA